MAKFPFPCYNLGYMKIMGIDPGTARLGWGIIDATGGVVRALSYGCITTDSHASPDKRLLVVYDSILGIIKKEKPDCVAIEDLFFAVNAKTVIPVAQARGVTLLAAAKTGTPVVSYTPLVVKQTITDTGTADKTQVGKMITRLLKLPRVPQPDDTADALAIALTHAYSYKGKRRFV